MIYLLSRGFKPYDDEWFGDDHGPRIATLLPEMNFSDTGDDVVDPTDELERGRKLVPRPVY